MAGVVLVVLLAAGCTPLDSGAAVARGGQVFQDQGCYGCHTVGPTGTPIATDLTRIGARHVAEAHGGRVDIESQLGRGSTFTVSIPLAAQPALT